MQRIGVLVFAILLFLEPIQAQTLEVGSFELENGMKLLVHEDHDIPNVAMYFFFQVGARNERPGITGISHYFEHMMFNGTKRYGPKQFDIVMERHGGRNNAYTSPDITAYTDWFPRDALELMMDMESDRMVNLQFDPKIVESERGVVANERKLGVDNSNLGTLWEQLNAAAYTAHPYGWPVIGWASDIEAWSMEDLKSHYRMGYAPNNCTMVVVGDVETAAVVKLAKKYFEPIPRQKPPPTVRTKEPEQKGERRVVVRKQAQLPMMLVSYHVPESRHSDYAAIEVLGAILAEGRSSRLYRRLVDQDQLARTVSHSRSDSLDPGQLVFDLRPRSGVSPEKAERALYEELERVGEDGVSERELEKAKNILLVDLYRDLRTIAGKANRLGQYEVFFGDHSRLFSAREEVAKVSVGDVQRVARSYLDANKRTVATLIPETKEVAQ